ncbi:MAG: hypothetical protein ACYDC0_16310 [Acidimicrobiales bacterium]
MTDRSSIEAIVSNVARVGGTPVDPPRYPVSDCQPVSTSHIVFSRSLMYGRIVSLAGTGARIAITTPGTQLGESILIGKQPARVVSKQRPPSRISLPAVHSARYRTAPPTVRPHG